MTSVDLPCPARVLAVGAHPDDVEFGCGATLAKWAAAGAHVELLVLTDGSKGSWDPDADPAALVATRTREQDDAARMLGAVGVHRAGHVDGELVADVAGRAAVSRVIRVVRPEVVLAHDPWRRYRLHPDHRHAGFLALDGLVAARDPHFFPGEGVPHRPDRVLLFEAETVDHLERVSGRDVETKIAALLCHRSQWRSTMGIADDDVDAGRTAFVRGVEQEAASAGRPIGVPAEAFKVLTDL